MEVLKMMDKTKRHPQSLPFVAATLLFALGSAPLVAQEQASPYPDPHSQQETDPRAQQETGERDWQDRFRREEAEQAGAEHARDTSDDVAAAEAEAPPDAGLDALAREHENLTTFVEAVKAAGMEEALTGGTPYTVFAPTDEAFQRMDSDLDLQGGNREEIAGLLRAHIVADDVDPDMARRIPQAMTLDGGTVELSEENGELKVENATVVQEDIQHDNLRIYAIDTVLVASADITRDEPAQRQDEDGADEWRADG
jgi:uncharacterized surface protein with fasciclin (FAS1) repeats